MLGKIFYAKVLPVLLSGALVLPGYAVNQNETEKANIVSEDSSASDISDKEENITEVPSDTYEDGNTETLVERGFSLATSGSCGEGNVAWDLDTETGILTITGNGEMTSHDWTNTATIIKQVIISEGITNIVESAFDGCKSLTSISIPDSVISIGNSAFSSCSSLTAVTIPNSVTSIEKYAFYNCTSLTAITIPNSVTSIKDSTFDNCKSLTAVTIPDSVTYIGHSAFSSCSSLTNVTIPDSVTYIGGSAFSYCESLTTVTIPDSVTFIESFAFESITSVCLPNSKIKIASYAFSNIINVHFNGTKEQWYSMDISDNSIKNANLYFSDGTKLIQKKINENISYEYIEDTKTLTLYGTGTMTDYNDKSESDLGYYNRPYAPIASSIEKITVDKGITSIGSWAFAHCNSLQSISLPEGITSIGDAAFFCCTSLKSISLPKEITSIGTWAFFTCPSLESISLPKGITSIGSKAFEGCSSLKSISLPEGITSIGYCIFYNCVSLESMYIPKDIPTLDLCYDCYKLSDIYFNGTKEQWSKIYGHDSLEKDTITIHYNSPEEPEPVNPHEDEEADEEAVSAADKGLGAKTDTVAVKENEKKFSINLDQEATSSVVTVAAGNKFSINCKDATDYVVMPSSKKNIKLSSKGEVTASKATSEGYIAYFNSKGELSSIKLVILNVTDTSKTASSALGITKTSKLSFTTQVGNDFNIPLYNLPLSAKFSSPTGKTDAVSNGGYGVIGSDGYYHIKGTAKSKGNINIPFTVNGKKFTAKLIIK